MKAVRVNEFGKPVSVEDIARPEPGNDEVLVRVRAASINPLDWKIVAGYLGDYFPIPRTLGSDFAGDVEVVGPAVTGFKPGDAVFGMKSGSMAEYVVVKESELAKKPQTLDYVQSAAVGLAGLCAKQSLVDVANLQSGERVLIIGAGGGVGLAAAQLAKNAGAHVAVTVKEDQVEFFRELGVDEIIGPDSERFEEYAGDADVILDLVGGDHVGRSLEACGPGARYVTPAAFFVPEVDPSRGISASMVATQTSGADMAHLAEEIDAGRLKVFVAQTYPLEEAQKALDYKRQDGTQGKVVVTVA